MHPAESVFSFLVLNGTVFGGPSEIPILSIYERECRKSERQDATCCQHPRTPLNLAFIRPHIYHSITQSSVDFFKRLLVSESAKVTWQQTQFMRLARLNMMLSCDCACAGQTLLNTTQTNTNVNMVYQDIIVVLHFAHGVSSMLSVRRGWRTASSLRDRPRV